MWHIDEAMSFTRYSETYYNEILCRFIIGIVLIKALSFRRFVYIAIVVSVLTTFNSLDSARRSRFYTVCTLVFVLNLQGDVFTSISIFEQSSMTVYMLRVVIHKRLL